MDDLNSSAFNGLAMLKNYSQKSNSLTKSESCDDYLSIGNRNDLNEVFGMSNRSISNDGRLRSVYQTKEEELKMEYYKSNPLRYYAPTRGQRILPQLPADRTGSVLPALGSHQSKKALPAIYSELRETANVTVDRELHKKRLRTMLKINLNGINQPKNLIDKLENSRKTYTEFSRLNKSKPLDCSRIESVLKGNGRSQVYTSNQLSHSRNKSYHPRTTHSTPGLIQARNESVSHYARTPMSLHAHTQMEKRSTLSQNRELVSDSTDSNQLLVDAQQLSIKDLGEISEEFRMRKIKLAKLELLNSNLHSYKTMNNPNPSLTSMAQPAEAESSHPFGGGVKSTARSSVKRGKVSRNPTKPASLRKTRFADRKISLEDETDLDYYEPRANLLNLAITSLGPSNAQASNELEEDAYNPPSIDKEQFILINGNNLVDLNLKNHVLQSRVMSPKSKYKLRIKQAREKILNETNEKENLNKMTILQPFEETKLVINIDKVPSKLLNNLLNKQSMAPRYIIPPARAFGYFKKVMSPFDTAQPTQAQPLLNANNSNLNITTNTLNSRTKSAKNNQHHAHTLTDQSKSNHRQKVTKGDEMGLESLKSLSEAQSILLFEKSELMSKSDRFNQPKNDSKNENTIVITT